MAPTPTPTTGRPRTEPGSAPEQTPPAPSQSTPPQIWRGLSAEPPPEHGTLDVPFDQYQRYRITADLARAMTTAGTGDTSSENAPSARVDVHAPVRHDANAPAPAYARPDTPALVANASAAVRHDTAASVANTPLRVLDVGGHHSDFWGRVRRPIADFLPEAFSATLDVAANPLRGYVRGRGDALPFHAGSFDLVCSVDVLEHVPPTARTQLVDELQRVSSRGIVLAAPFRHPLLERAESFVSEFIQRTCGYTQGQLEEHRDLGWPDLKQTWRDLTRAGWHARVFPYGNLWRWMLMMIDKHALSAIAGSRALQSRLDRAYNETWFATDRALPAYRHFLVAARRDDDPLLQAAEHQFNAVRDPESLENETPASPMLPARSTSPAPLAHQTRSEPAFAEAMFALLEIHAQNQTLQAQLEPDRRDSHVAELETLRAELYKNVDALTQENARLVAMLRNIERSAPYRALTALKRLFPFGR